MDQPPVTANDRLGLCILEREELELAEVVDDVFRAWARRVGAIERRYAPLISVADLQGFDYFDNFPHLGLAVTPLVTEEVAQLIGNPRDTFDSLPRAAMQAARYLLPSAACYSVYLRDANSSVPSGGVVHTLAATCFRNEEAYDGLARLLGFTMREVVFVGENDRSKTHLETFVSKVSELTKLLDIPMAIEVATDPFFDKDGSRARMQRLFPVKREFLIYGVAVGSVNYHRNFFGERCRITLQNGEFAYTSCAAFGIERWVHVLSRHFGGPANAAKELRRCAIA